MLNIKEPTVTWTEFHIIKMEKSMSNVIKNAELFWVKLDPENPVDPFNSGKLVWEIQMRTADKKVAKAWKDKGLPVRHLEEENVFACNVKKLAKNAKGDDLTPPRVVDGKLNPMDPTKIGNGSIGNVQLSPREWAMGGKTGVVFDLMAVQVVKLVEYSGSNLEFDVVDLDPDTAADAEEAFAVEDDDF